ncbi:MAG: methyltransferase domain-containing protein [Pirellulales bacterium]|nr:methyltransferase domain-containing protein [Pirellulales bacterium]
MFFPGRIQNIAPTDRVLEVGPGGMPHPRANVFLEKVFSNPSIAKEQRGHVPSLVTDKPIITYQDGRFPFDDHEFDYVICSHVLEHILDVDSFVRELTRVARRGYVEFPTIYYDYLYDFPEHPTIVFFRDGTIFWMPKNETCLPAFRPVTRLFYASLVAGHTALIDTLAPCLFQGFEWESTIKTQRTRDIYDVCYAPDTWTIPRVSERRSLSHSITRWLRRKRRAA